MFPRIQQLAERYGLDRLEPALRQQVSKEVYYHLFTTDSLAERLSQMVDALLLRQVATPLAFDHRFITPFSPVGSSGLNCKSTGILSNVQRHVTTPRLTMVEFFSNALLWEYMIYFYVDDPNRHRHCASSRQRCCPWSRPPSEQTTLIPLFFLTHSQLKTVIHIKDDGQATLTLTGAYTAASRVLCSYTQSIPIQESFVYQAPEFMNMDVPCSPTKAMDVYAFGSTLYTVRSCLGSIFSLYFSVAHEILLQGLCGCRTV